MPRRIRLALIGLLALAGCAARKPVPPTAPPPPPPVEGRSWYTYVFDPVNLALGLPEDVRFLRPKPLETKTLPIYPERALAAHDGPHREVVRIVIDAKGNVGQVLDSPVATSDGGPYAQEYRRAVDEAVRTWRFEPGVFVHTRNADYKVMTLWEEVAVYYDVRFTFEIVDGKGVVKPSP